MKVRFNITVLWLILPLIVSCASSHNNLNSTLWIQTSVEYQAIAKATYQTAAAKLTAALRDKHWTAALEQTENYEGLPPAVVLDIDETTLDNSPFQAESITGKSAFSNAAWDRWISMAKAEPVPGVLPFIRDAKKKGIRVIYLTNRKCNRRSDHPAPCPQEADTVRNLLYRGFPEIDPEEEMLLQNERNGWTGEKSSRRRQVAKKYRILMLIGDDLGDFLPDVKKGVSTEQRAQKAAPFDAYWGEKWFMLPNPTYGSWLRILNQPKTQHLKGYK